MKLLKSGRLPEERQGSVLEMIGKRGTSDDLAYIYQQALRPGGFSEPIRCKALDALAEAARNRKLRPLGELDALGQLIELKGSKADAAVRLAAIRLAGLWKVEALSGALRAIAQSADPDDSFRAPALDALAAIGGAAGRTSIESLTGSDRPWNVRALAVAALVKLDVDAAVDRAVALVRNATPRQDLAPLMAAFLNRQSGAEKLADALAKQTLPADAAKLALRSMYALGRSDPALVAELSRAAGINTEVKVLEKPELERLVADVMAKGDPERGEVVFRRADLSCTKCHAVSGAGGGVGPDLSALGSSSPVDYIINSILVPDQSIKEEFQTLFVLTSDGRVFHGIVADKDDKRIVLKEATGQLRELPAGEVEESKEGGSLMPKGLVNLMTTSEFLDLVRFLSELGKPGTYAIRSTPTIQRWRVLKPVPQGLAQSVPNAETFRTQVLGADANQWLPAYAKVVGMLPLDELTAEVGSKVLYLQGEIDVSSGGEITFRCNSSTGISAWVDDQSARSVETFTTKLRNGRHELILRVDTTVSSIRDVMVEVIKPAGSSAEFSVVGGR